MRLADVVSVSRTVAATTGRLDKIGHLAGLLSSVPPAGMPIVIGLLSGVARQGRLKIGAAIFSGMRDVSPAVAPSIESGEVDAAFERIAGVSGAGSAADRSQLLAHLLERATRDEQDFLIRLLFGELRQGALAGVLMDAVARASGIPVSKIRRATMLTGDLAPVARTALVDGDAALSQFVLRPFQPMLADSASDVGAAIATLGHASL